MLDQDRQWLRKAGNRLDLLAYQQRPDRDMAEQPACSGVVRPALVAQLVYLADIVKHDSGQQHVAVQLGITLRDRAPQADQADDVLEQSADEGVMHAHRGGRALQPWYDRRITDDAFQQPLDPGILDAR